MVLMSIVYMYESSVPKLNTLQMQHKELAIVLFAFRQTSLCQKIIQLYFLDLDDLHNLYCVPIFVG
jgi:hypothetical protein